MLNRRAVPGSIHRAALGILLLAAFLRFWHLGSLPPGMFRDELEKGYTAWELWTTGRHGVFLTDGSGGVETTRYLPAFIDVFGDSTSAIYQYLDAPIVGLFGLGTTTTRLVAALCGTLAAWFGWLLARRWWGAAGGLGTLFLLAASPTQVLFSRWAQQGITVPLWTLAALWLLDILPDLPERHRRSAAASAGLLLGLAFYSYDPARLVVPLLVVGWAVCRPAWCRAHRSHALVAFGCFLLLALPVFLHAMTATGASRFSRVSVFAAGILPGLRQAFVNYLAHFQPSFLFWAGDANHRHGLPGMGVVAPTEAPFLLLGIWSVLRKRHGPGLFVLWWILAGPAAAALTRDGVPHALRSILMMPALHLLGGAGVMEMAALARGRWWLKPVLALLAVTQVFLVGRALFTRLARQGDPWQYGVFEALDRMEEIPHERAWLSADVPYAPYFVLFHRRVPPRDFQERGLEALPVGVVPPGVAIGDLPPGSVLATPPRTLFDPVGPLDIPSLEGEGAPAMVIQVSGPTLHP